MKSGSDRTPFDRMGSALRTVDTIPIPQREIDPVNPVGDEVAIQQLEAIRRSRFPKVFIARSFVRTTVIMGCPPRHAFPTGTRDADRLSGNGPRAFFRQLGGRGLGSG
jgi:hypothetical protein